MLDDIIEIILEIVIEGITIAAESQKVPTPVRIFLVAMLAGVFLALGALLLWIGIHSESTILSVLSVILLIGMIVLIGKKIREFKKKQED